MLTCSYFYIYTHCHNTKCMVPLCLLLHPYMGICCISYIHTREEGSSEAFMVPIYACMYGNQDSINSAMKPETTSTLAQYTHTRAHTHTCMHTHARTHAHTHTHTRTHLNIGKHLFWLPSLNQQIFRTAHTRLVVIAHCMNTMECRTATDNNKSFLQRTL